MARKTTEEKLAEQIQLALDNHWFNPAILASLIVDENLYYQDKLNELIELIIKQQSMMYYRQWEHGYTNQGLINSAYLQEVIDNRNAGTAKWVEVNNKKKTRTE
jgi:hypothetical protein